MGTLSDDTPLFNTIAVTTYGGSKNDAGLTVIKTTDGGFMVGGYTQSMDGDISEKNHEDFDFWLLKFNAFGNLEWNTTVGTSFNEKSTDIIQTPELGYVVVGSFDQKNQHQTRDDFWAVKVDASATLEWEKAFGYEGLDTATALLQTNDGGYLLTGVLDVTASQGAGNTASKKRLQKHAGGDYWLIKLNAEGILQWSQYYGGSFTDTPAGVVETADGGFLLVGTSDSNDVDISANKGSYDIWLVKASSTGVLEWEKSYGGSQLDQASAIDRTTDGNFIIVGDTRSDDGDISHNRGASDLWVLKISPQGTLLWEKTFGGTDFDTGRSVCLASDGGFYVAGHSRSSEGDLTLNNGQNDAWVMKINSEGNLMWQKSIGGTGIDFANAIAELEDESLVVVGETNSDDSDIPENKGFKDLLLIHLKN